MSDEQEIVDGSPDAEHVIADLSLEHETGRLEISLLHPDSGSLVTLVAPSVRAMVDGSVLIFRFETVVTDLMQRLLADLMRSAEGEDS